MLFDNFNIGGAVRHPKQPDAPLSNGPYAILPRPIKFHLFTYGYHVENGNLFKKIEVYSAVGLAHMRFPKLKR